MKITFLALVLSIFTVPAFASSTFILNNIYDPSAHQIVSAEAKQGLLKMSILGGGMVMVKLVNGEKPEEVVKLFNGATTDAVFACLDFSRMDKLDGVCNKYKIILASELREKYKCDKIAERSAWQFVKANTKYSVTLKKGMEYADVLLKATDEQVGLYSVFKEAEIVPNTDVCAGAVACVDRLEYMLGLRKIHVDLDQITSDLALAQILIHETVHLAGITDECETEKVALSVSNLAGIRNYTSGYSNTCPDILDDTLEDFKRVKSTPGQVCWAEDLLK